MARWTELGDAGARSVLAAYFAKVDRALAALPRAEADEVKAELESHALDALAEAGGASETGARVALAQLGEPDDFLPSLVAGRLRARAARTFNPGHVASALARSAAAGFVGLVSSILVGLGYVVATLCVALGVAKLFAPNGIGAYRLETGALFIGADENVRGVDVLGLWFSPLAIAVGACLYVVLTWAFGRATARTRAPLGREAMED